MNSELIGGITSPKKRNTAPIRGVIPPLVTPFRADGGLCEDSFADEVRLMASSGVHGLSVGGSTGEGAVLDDVELQALLRIVDEINQRRLPVVCGVIRTSTRDAIRTGLVARDGGATALMVTPTFYHGTDDAGNFAFYDELASAVGLPLIVYNVVAQNPISPALMQKMAAEIEGVMGIKQSVGGLHGLNDMLAACDNRTRVYGAQDDALFCSYLLGAVGAISAILTAFPALCVEQWDAAQSGDLARAREIHFRLLPVWQLVSCEKMAFIGRVKTILRLLGRNGGYARHPILAPSQEVESLLRSALSAAGFQPIKK